MDTLLFDPPLEAINCYEELDEACISYGESYKRFLAGRSYGSHLSRTEAHAWLRRLAYCLISKAVADEDPFYELDDRVEEYGRRTRGVDGNPNQFQTGLLAMFAHDKDMQTAKHRFQMGKQLEYAHYHFVPVCFLEGFLKDVGFSRAIDQAGTKTIDPTYREWVVEKLSTSGTSDYRLEQYPTSIIESVRDLRRRRRKRGRPSADVDDWD